MISEEQMLLYTFIWKHNVYKQKRDAALLERKMHEKQGGLRKDVELIKSLIYARKKISAWGAFEKDRAEFVGW
jgi:hypothetical protein